MGGKSVQNRGASVPKIAVWRALFLRVHPEVRFPGVVGVAQSVMGSKNNPNFNLMCSVYSTLYRYFMLQDGLFCLSSPKYRILSLLNRLKNRFNLFFSEKLR
ncbi:hypothetical protein MJ579_26930 [Klebsiella pneumoniae]|nr:hypothetical protein MJ579_26930 [Klebsiella pneumoniae]